MELTQLKIPTHVSIIMDGNGRWAKAKGMPRTFGHKKGAEVVMDIVEDADSLGIKYLTVYAFSTENWSRPETEVGLLMNLFKKYLKLCHTKAMQNNTRVRILGDKTAFHGELAESIRILEEDTRQNTGMNFQIAMNYGSRDEMLRAMRKMLDQYDAGLIKKGDLDESYFSSLLDTADIPDPDLMIRTSGEERLSNYLMWQHAYSEFYFTDTPWPDFNKAELIKALEAYTLRDRRYGKVKEV